MKIFHQIIVVAFICLVLFIVRDEVKVVYNNATSFISSKTNSSVKDNIIIKAEEVSSLFKSINTPGALQVKEGLVSNTNKVNISVSDVIIWTNRNRELNGNMAPLEENSKLNLSAKMKVDDMFKQQYFEHVSPGGVGVSDLGDKVAYQYIIIGENLALGNFKDSQALIDAWMASPGHRANILNKNYTEIGVAVGRGTFRGQDTWMAVQHFALPRSACPAIDEILHGVINLNQKEIKTIELDLNIRRKNIDSGEVHEGKTTNEQINDYNSLVAKYNQLILNLKEKISDYNAGVREFNTCLSENTQS